MGIEKMEHGKSSARICFHDEHVAGSSPNFHGRI